MEFDEGASEKSDHAAAVVLSPSEELSTTQPPAAAGGTARLYECTFCKRGFSNAQALGGHMNIHRKDKAKLRQASSSSSSSNETTLQLLKDIVPSNTALNVVLLETSSEIKATEEGGTHVREVHGLPPLARKELDLELRLGHEPPSDSYSTRIFF